MYNARDVRYREAGIYCGPMISMVRRFEYAFVVYGSKQPRRNIEDGIEIVPPQIGQWFPGCAVVGAAQDLGTGSGGYRWRLTEK